jgi:hypothetical protein
MQVFDTDTVVWHSIRKWSHICWCALNRRTKFSWPILIWIIFDWITVFIIMYLCRVLFKLHIMHDSWFMTNCSFFWMILHYIACQMVHCLLLHSIKFCVKFLIEVQPKVNWLTSVNWRKTFRQQTCWNHIRTSTN